MPVTFDYLTLNGKKYFPDAGGNFTLVNAEVLDTMPEEDDKNMFLQNNPSAMVI